MVLFSSSVFSRLSMHYYIYIYIIIIIYIYLVHMLRGGSKTLLEALFLPSPRRPCRVISKVSWVCHRGQPRVRGERGPQESCSCGPDPSLKWGGEQERPSSSSKASRASSRSSHLYWQHWQHSKQPSARGCAGHSACSTRSTHSSWPAWDAQGNPCFCRWAGPWLQPATWGAPLWTAQDLLEGAFVL